MKALMVLVSLFSMNALALDGPAFEAPSCSDVARSYVSEKVEGTQIRFIMSTASLTSTVNGKHFQCYRYGDTSSGFEYEVIYTVQSERCVLLNESGVYREISPDQEVTPWSTSCSKGQLYVESN